MHILWVLDSKCKQSTYLHNTYLYVVNKILQHRRHLVYMEREMVELRLISSLMWPALLPDRSSHIRGVVSPYSLSWEGPISWLDVLSAFKSGLFKGGSLSWEGSLYYGNISKSLMNIMKQHSSKVYWHHRKFTAIWKLTGRPFFRYRTLEGP